MVDSWTPCTAFNWGFNFPSPIRQYQTSPPRRVCWHGDKAVRERCRTGRISRREGRKQAGRRGGETFVFIIPYPHGIWGDTERNSHGGWDSVTRSRVGGRQTRDQRVIVFEKLLLFVCRTCIWTQICYKHLLHVISTSCDVTNGIRHAFMSRKAQITRIAWARWHVCKAMSAEICFLIPPVWSRVPFSGFSPGQPFLTLTVKDAALTCNCKPHWLQSCQMQDNAYGVACSGIELGESQADTITQSLLMRSCTTYRGTSNQCDSPAGISSYVQSKWLLVIPENQLVSECMAFWQKNASDPNCNHAFP